MKLTQNQISEFITELTATSQGIQELFSVILNALMKHERTLWQQEQHESSNGFRPRRIRYKGLEFALKSASYTRWRLLSISLGHTSR